VPLLALEHSMSFMYLHLARSCTYYLNFSNGSESTSRMRGKRGFIIIFSTLTNSCLGRHCHHRHQFVESYGLLRPSLLPSFPNPGSLLHFGYAKDRPAGGLYKMKWGRSTCLNATACLMSVPFVRRKCGEKWPPNLVGNWTHDLFLYLIVIIAYLSRTLHVQ